MTTQDQDGQNTARQQLRDLAHRRSAAQFETRATVLDHKLCALAGLGAALALWRPSPTVRSLAEHAIAAGATAEEVLGVLMAVAPAIGTARVVANTPWLALAIGYDLDAALEGTENTASGRAQAGHEECQQIIRSG